MSLTIAVYSYRVLLRDLYLLDRLIVLICTKPFKKSICAGTEHRLLGNLIPNVLESSACYNQARSHSGTPKVNPHRPATPNGWMTSAAEEDLDVNLVSRCFVFYAPMQEGTMIMILAVHAEVMRKKK